MIRTVSGSVTYLGPQQVVVEAHGVGYLVMIADRSMKPVGSEVRFFTYHHMREDGQSLYGFDTMEELELFEQLITVPSIGPKLAMAILSVATPSEVRSAVGGDNAGFFQAIPGVGKKSALKIIIELKGKLTGQAGAAVPTGGLALADALAGLGYAPAEIQHVIGRVPADLTDEAQVSWALRELAQR